MFPNIKQRFGFIRCSSQSFNLPKIGTLLAVTALASSAAGATTGPCSQNAVRLSEPETIVASTDVDGSAWFEVELPVDRFIVVETQSTGLGHPRPSVRVFDESCRPWASPRGTTVLQGRAVVRSERRQRAFIEVWAQASEVFILDLWSDTGLPSRVSWTKDGDDTPVPPAPIDEWDEIGFDNNPCEARQATKDGDDTPVPPAPIDEWDELRGPGRECDRPKTVQEIQGVGLAELTGDRLQWRTWCPWATHSGLLGTLTCARGLTMTEESEVTLRRVLDDRSEMLAVRLDRPGHLDARGIGSWTLWDASGQPMAEQDGHLKEGLYFLQVHHPDSVYALTFLP